MVVLMPRLFWCGLLITPTLASLCTSSLDCSLNGDCVSGSCACDPGWVGQSCGVLDLLPVNKSHSYVAPDGYSSWGMSLVKDPATGQWHGFVSEFANKCKCLSWTTNSYVNHIVASSPEGPWKQAGTAIGVWAHNPKVLYSPTDKTWLIFHIGDGTPHGPVQDCRKASAPMTENITVPKARLESVAPFYIHHSASLDGPWQRAANVQLSASEGHQMTKYPNTTNVPLNPSPCPSPIEGSLMIYEKSEQGNGKLEVPLSQFGSNLKRGGVLAWDACGSAGLKFDNGHPVQGASGSMVGAVALNTSKGFVVRPGWPCAMTYDYPAADIHMLAPISPSDGVKTIQAGANYFEVSAALEEKSSGSCVLGTYEDAEGCRTACEGKVSCSSYTWMGKGDGRCAVRGDEHWEPSSAEGFVSGRPWLYDRDNPAPVIDQTTGEVRVLYRTDSNGGDERGYHVASLIGQAKAPRWTGPYTQYSAFDGPISSPQYPYEENEDPFMWRSKRGWHAVFHTTTWTDSRGKHYPAAKWAGRHAFSVDGLTWQFSPVPAYNSTIRFTNGEVEVYSRMERPFLLFDGDGNPTHLFNAVQEKDDDDYSFNLMHRVRTQKMDVSPVVV